jgi:hypothetical protein
MGCWTSGRQCRGGEVHRPRLLVDLTPRVSQIHLNYETMENQLRTMQDMLATEQKDHRETRELVNAFNSQIQAFMAVRNNNTFITFITFSDIYVC